MQQEKPRKKRKKRMRLPNGIGSVHLIGDGKARRNPWRARVPSHVEIDEKKGIAKQKYITVGYFPTEIEAIDALMAYRKNPFTLEAATATFEDVFEAWKAKRYPDFSESSKKSYNAAYKNSEPLHKMKMRDIRTAHLESVMSTVKGGYNLQVRLKTFWGLLFKYALEHDIIQKNYSQFVKTRDKDEGTKRTDIPAADRKKIWEAADSGDVAAQIAMVYIYTGFRATELLEVKKSDVDLEARFIVGGKKTAAGKTRRVPIHKSILPFIERMMESRGEYLLSKQGKKGTWKKHPYSSFIKLTWNPLMERLGFEEYTPHYCRHTCATMLREVNVAEDVRKLILGHKSTDITDRYTHIPDSMLLEAIDLLPGRN